MYKVVEDFLDPEYKENVRRKVTEEVREEGRAKGLKEGTINTLIKLVKKGRLTVEEAAEECEITAEQFTEQYLTPASA